MEVLALYFGGSFLAIFLTTSFKQILANRRFNLEIEISKWKRVREERRRENA